MAALGREQTSTVRRQPEQQGGQREGFRGRAWPVAVRVGSCGAPRR